MADDLAAALDTLASSDVDDDGWAALVCAAAAQRCDAPTPDPAAVTAVLAGSASTSTLPATLAAKVVGRLAARDVDAARVAARRDGRRAVVDELEAAQPAGTLPADLDELLDALVAATVERSDHRFEISYAPWRRLDGLPASAAVAAAVFEGVCAGVLPGTDDPRDVEVFDAAMPYMVAALDEDVVAELLAVAVAAHTDADRATAAAAVVFAVVSSVARSGVSWDADHELLAAVTPSVGLAWDVLARATVSAPGSTAQLAATVWAARNGVPVLGPRSIALALGSEAPHLGRNGELLLAAAVASGTPTAVDEVLSALTEDGTRPRVLDYPSIDRSSPALPVQVAVAAMAGDVRSPLEVLRFVAACNGSYGHRWSPEDTAAAFDRFETVADALLTRLWPVPLDGHAAVYDGPDWLAVESQRRCGLLRWVVAIPEVRDELVAAAAGVGLPRWQVIVELLPTFRGTVTELVAVADAVAPDR